ncbi:hypothetical protein [Chroococcidiopsis sp. CCALA 051]|nr:hypothetical protein [Chroococcidiopsis sp. CCALA 051]
MLATKFISTWQVRAIAPILGKFIPSNSIPSKKVVQSVHFV